MSVYRFQQHELDPQARTLHSAGHPVGIEPRVLDVVVYLIEQRHRAVGRDELIAAAWGRADCSDATLAQAILKARRLFGDSGEAQRTIRTAPRFGYQWVAALQADDADSTLVNAPIAEQATVDRLSTRAVQVRTVDANAHAAVIPRRRPWRLPIAGVVALAIIGAVWWACTPLPGAHRMRPVAGLILVMPANVHSAVAQDGWMRLGLMAMSADALRTLPGRSLVANETVLAAAGGASAATEEHLREVTGATTIVSIDARRHDERWALDATVLSAGGGRQLVSAEDGDAVAAAAALAERLRGALGGDAAESQVTSESLVAIARMQAAILGGHAEHAVAIADAADPASKVPEIALLRAAAMNRLGKAETASGAMHALIERAGTTTPAWLAPAWKTLGYAELLRGHAPSAENAFHHAIAAAGNDIGEMARAWRGLGNAQAMDGDFAQAEASALRARLELGDTGDPLLRAHIEDDLGTVAGRRGRYDDAIAHYRQAAELASSIGATELELGSRMNIALSQAEQLHHSQALASWRELLPRLRALDYPSMQRYAAVHYAQALAETGALAEARIELQRSEALAPASHDGLDDAEIDALHVEWMLGDHGTLRDAARRLAIGGGNASRRAAASTVLVLSDLADDDVAAARNDASTLPTAEPGEDPSTHAQALAALATVQSRSGADALAEDNYAKALALVRESGSPRDLREIVLPYAEFQLAHDHVDAARTTAGLVQPFADEDFAITLLLARLASDQAPVEAARLYERARALAGARMLPARAGAHPALAATAGR